jgi:hypothetical protein
MPLRGSASCFIKIFIHNKIPTLVLYFYFIIYNLYNIFFLINKDINIFIYYIFLEDQIYKRYYINLYVKLFMPLRGYASLYNDFYSIFMPLRGSASFLYNNFYSIFMPLRGSASFYIMIFIHSLGLFAVL